MSVKYLLLSVICTLFSFNSSFANENYTWKEEKLTHLEHFCVKHSIETISTFLENVKSIDDIDDKSLQVIIKSCRVNNFSDAMLNNYRLEKLENM